MIDIKIYASETEVLEYTFTSKEAKKVISFGRIGCNINIDFTGISKRQCSITLEDDKFYIYDGFINKKSTNGTW